MRFRRLLLVSLLFPTVVLTVQALPQSPSPARAATAAAQEVPAYQRYLSPASPLEVVAALNLLEAGQRFGGSGAIHG